MSLRNIDFVLKKYDNVKEFHRKDNTTGTYQSLLGNNGREDFKIILWSNDLIIDQELLGKQLTFTESMWKKNQDRFEVHTTTKTKIILNGQEIKPKMGYDSPNYQYPPTQPQPTQYQLQPAQPQLQQVQQPQVSENAPLNNNVGYMDTNTNPPSSSSNENFPINGLVEKVDNLDFSLRSFVNKGENRYLQIKEQITELKYQISMLSESIHTTKQFVEVFEDKIKILMNQQFGKTDFESPKTQTSLEIEDQDVYDQQEEITNELVELPKKSTKKLPKK